MNFFVQHHEKYWKSFFRKFAPCIFMIIVVLVSSEAFSQIAAGIWYRGDIHAHSLYSDGDSPVADVIANAEELGLDFFALTDHDTLMNGIPDHWNDPDYHSEQMVILYGIEWTTSRGHANIWSGDPFSYSNLWKANGTLDVETAISAAHSQGALFSINHPAAFFCCPWEYQIVDEVDSIEVWNSMYRLPNFNRWAGHQCWDSLLQSGYRIPCVGGSDMHQLKKWQSNLFGIGNPTNWVYAENLTADAILDAIKAGHTTLSYAPDSARLEFYADINGDAVYDIMMGDIAHIDTNSVSFQIDIVEPDNKQATHKGKIYELDDSFVRGLREESLDINGILENLPQPGERDLINFNIVSVFKGGVLFRVWILSDGAHSVTFIDKPETSTYYRVELAESPEVEPVQHLLYGRIIALTNPIYIDIP